MYRFEEKKNPKIRGNIYLSPLLNPNNEIHDLISVDLLPTEINEKKALQNDEKKALQMTRKKLVKNDEFRLVFLLLI